MTGVWFIFMTLPEKDGKVLQHYKERSNPKEVKQQDPEASSVRVSQA